MFGVERNSLEVVKETGMRNLANWYVRYPVRFEQLEESMSPAPLGLGRNQTEGTALSIKNSWFAGLFDSPNTMWPPSRLFCSCRFKSFLVVAAARSGLNDALTFIANFVDGYKR